MPSRDKTFLLVLAVISVTCSGGSEASAPCRPALVPQWAVPPIPSSFAFDWEPLAIRPNLVGRPALVAVGSYERLSVFGLDGGGAETLSIDMSPAAAASAVIEDVDGDGAADVVALDFQNSRVSIRHGDGTGSFRAPVFLELPGTPSAVVARDLNGDGRIDLAVARTDGVLSVMLGAAGGGFGEPATYATKSGAGASMVASDLDGDGAIDLAVAYRYPSDMCPQPPCHCLPYYTTGMAVLAGRGDGSFAAPRIIPTQYGPFGLIAADLGVGAGAAVAMSFSQALCGQVEKTMTAVWHDGLAEPVEVLSSPNHVSNPAVLDLNRDGRLDLAVQSGCSIVGLLARPNGSFAATMLLESVSGTCPRVHGTLLAGPLDTDPFDELAFGDVELRTFDTACAP